MLNSSICSINSFRVSIVWWDAMLKRIYCVLCTHNIWWAAEESKIFRMQISARQSLEVIIHESRLFETLNERRLNSSAKCTWKHSAPVDKSKILQHTIKLNLCSMYGRMGACVLIFRNDKEEKKCVLWAWQVQSTKSNLSHTNRRLRAKNVVNWDKNTLKPIRASGLRMHILNRL